jgi:hypothetical protein
MNFPASSFGQVNLVQPDPWSPVGVAIFTVDGNPGPVPSYNDINLQNGPWGAWGYAVVKPGMQRVNGQQCNQLGDFVVQVPQSITEETSSDWVNQILAASNDPDNSFGIYMRYGC